MLKFLNLNHCTPGGLVNHESITLNPFTDSSSGRCPFLASKCPGAFKYYIYSVLISNFLFLKNIVIFHGALFSSSFYQIFLTFSKKKKKKKKKNAYKKILFSTYERRPDTSPSLTRELLRSRIDHEFSTALIHVSIPQIFQKFCTLHIWNTVSTFFSSYLVKLNYAYSYLFSYLVSRHVLLFFRIFN